MPIYPQIRLDCCVGPHTPSLASRPWIERHIIFLVEGDGEGWKYLAESDIESVGGFDRALESAREHLDELMRQPNSVTAGTDAEGSVAFLVAQGNCFVSGLALEPSFLDLCQQHLGTGFKFCMPGVDELVAFRASDPDGSAATALESFYSNVHPVSPHIYVRDEMGTVQVHEMRDYDPDRLEIRDLAICVPAAGAVVERSVDSRFFADAVESPLTAEHAQRLESFRRIGAALIDLYKAAPDGRLSPQVLDKVLIAWRADAAEERMPAQAAACGIGTMLGDLLCAVLPGEWITCDGGGALPIAVRSQSGGVGHPIDSVLKRFDTPEATISDLCSSILAADDGD